MVYWIFQINSAWFPGYTVDWYDEIDYPIPFKLLIKQFRLILPNKKFMNHESLNSAKLFLTFPKGTRAKFCNDSFSTICPEYSGTFNMFSAVAKAIDLAEKLICFYISVHRNCNNFLNIFFIEHCKNTQKFNNLRILKCATSESGPVIPKAPI